MSAASRWLVLAVLLPALAAAQTPAERVALARRHLRAHHPDSARAELLLAVDSSAGGSPGVRIEAFVLLGMVEDQLGSDSAARHAIREAVNINPDLQVDGLGELAPRVEAMLREERCRKAGRVTAQELCVDVRPPPPDTAIAPFQDCTRRCPEGVSKPMLQELPDIGLSLPSGRMGPSGVRGQVTLEFIVSPEGRADVGSARVYSSTIRAYEDLLMNRLPTARFVPAYAAAGAVAALVRMRFDFRATGLDRVSYTVKVL